MVFLFQNSNRHMAFLFVWKGIHIYYGRKRKFIYEDPSGLFPADLHVRAYDALHADPVTLQYR